MRKKVDYLQKVYEKNHETGNYVIEVSLDKYTDVFNDWDHSSYKKRDMDPDLSGFLDNCSEDIPLKYGIDICFYLPKMMQKDKKREEILITGVKTYYSFYIHAENKLLRESYQRILMYMVASFMFLTIGFALRTSVSDNIFYSTILEGLNIGGWVFLWEAISIFFFRRRKNLVEIKKYKRFLNSKIIFKYNLNSDTEKVIDNLDSMADMPV